MKKTSKLLILFFASFVGFATLSKTPAYSAGTCEVLPSTTLSYGYNGNLTIQYSEIKGTVRRYLVLPSGAKTDYERPTQDGVITFSLSKNSLTVGGEIKLYEIGPQDLLQCTAQITLGDAPAPTATPTTRANPTPTTSPSGPCQVLPSTNFNLGYRDSVTIKHPDIRNGGRYYLIIPNNQKTGPVFAGKNGEITISLKDTPPDIVRPGPTMNTSGTLELKEFNAWDNLLCSAQITVSQVTSTPTPRVTIVPPPSGTCGVFPASINEGFQGTITISGYGIESGKNYQVNLPDGSTLSSVPANDDLILIASLQRNPQNRSGEFIVRKTEFLGGVVCRGQLTIIGSSPPAEPTVDPTCFRINGRSDQINTALGCVPIGTLTGTLNSFIQWFLSKIIFVASGIAFLLMAFGAFQVITSAGDPKKMQAGKEVITSALSGLLFIILSIFLLKLIGVDILKIPGFG